MSGVYNIAPLQVSIEDTPEDFAFPASCISKGWLQKFFYPLRGNHKCESSSMLFVIVLAIGHLLITYWWKQFDRYLAHLRDNVLCPPVTILYLTTEPSPPRFKMDLPLQFNASFGHEANLTCNVSGIPRPVITWFKDGSRVKRSLVREFQGYSMLAFDFVRLNDQGKYWCEANNTEGWNRSSTANMIGISKLQANASQLT